MNALNAEFGFTITDAGRPLRLVQGRHFRLNPGEEARRLAEELTRPQVDLLRIAMAVHAADGWARRRRATDGHRRPVVEVEVLDAAFWGRPEAHDRLKECVDFLSGDDDWSFRFVQDDARHERRPPLLRGAYPCPLVALYSGGLDSAAGLAARLAEVPGRPVVPVALRFQMQKAALVRRHFDWLVGAGLATRRDLLPFQAGAYVKNARIGREHGQRLRQSGHRCRPLLFLAVAGLVADAVGATEVEVFESGVGSVNLPLVGGPADHRTSRSAHPHALRLASRLVSHVNDADVRFVLPFAHLTKAELVGRAGELGAGPLARASVSCIARPPRRGRGRQCGRCPACVYRRQAMITAGIDEGPDAYEVDLFDPAALPPDIPPQWLRPIRAFRQQAGRLADLEAGRVPGSFRTYLRATRAIDHDGQLAPHVEVHRRYRREWAALISDARRRGLPWAGARPRADARGATR